MMINEVQLETPAAEYDSPWKNVLEDFLQAFMEFCLPKAAKEIDWSRPLIPLDKELSKITRRQMIGNRYVDKLFGVGLKNGREVWLLVHIEVQTQPDSAFPERMFTYRYRLSDRFSKPILSVAILADESPGWRPTYYEHIFLYNKIRFEFAAVKLLDYANQEQLLSNSPNPFAIITWAHLQALKTKKNSRKRLQSKIHITRALYERGFSKEYILNLYRFIDWVMALPESLEIEYLSQIEELEEEKKMNYVTSAERIGIQRGRLEGREEGVQLGEAAVVLRLVKRKFGDVPAQYIQRIQEADAKTLLVWGERILDATTLEEMMEEE